MSAQRLSFATTDKPQPSAELKKWRTLPSLYFWKRRIGQIRSTSELTSQHIPSNLIIFGWSRIKGWHSILSSVIGSLKVSESSRKRLKAKLNCKLTNDWLSRIHLGQVARSQVTTLLRQSRRYILGNWDEGQEIIMWSCSWNLPHALRRARTLSRIADWIIT